MDLQPMLIETQLRVGDNIGWYCEHVGKIVLKTHPRGREYDKWKNLCETSPYCVVEPGLCGPVVVRAIEEE